MGFIINPFNFGMNGTPRSFIGSTGNSMDFGRTAQSLCSANEPATHSAALNSQRMQTNDVFAGNTSDASTRAYNFLKYPSQSCQTGNPYSVLNSGSALNPSYTSPTGYESYLSKMAAAAAYVQQYCPLGTANWCANPTNQYAGYSSAGGQNWVPSFSAAAAGSLHSTACFEDQSGPASRSSTAGPAAHLLPTFAEPARKMCRLMDDEINSNQVNPPLHQFKSSFSFSVDQNNGNRSTSNWIWTWNWTETICKHFCCFPSSKSSWNRISHSSFSFFQRFLVLY